MIIFTTGEALPGRVSKIPIGDFTFRSDWSYFMNFREIGVIKFISDSKFRSDWYYKIQIRKNDLLQKSENLTLITTFRLEYVKKITNFRVIGVIKVNSGKMTFCKIRKQSG